MHLSENEGIEGLRFAVIGGLGLVGSALCLELVRRGAEEVRSLDPSASSPWSNDLLKAGVVLVRGDVSNKKHVEKTLRGVDCVFHLAQHGISGKELLQDGRMDSVNITGTCNVLDVCHQGGVRRLVYMSTYNVVFGGKRIANGNEALKYLSLDDHDDPFGRSLSIAEQLVLKTNGRISKEKKNSRLYTCAIRPAAIYGPGEDRYISRIISLARIGLACARVGDASVKTDWVYVDNLVLALILASMGLLNDIPGREGHVVAAGQAYFINDGAPVNSFESIFRPVLQGIGYELPKRTLEVRHALVLANIVWFIYLLLHPWLDSSWLPEPIILPTEVYKIGVTHYFSFMKSRQELGYIPMVSPHDGLAATISYWKERNRKEIERPHVLEWLFVIVGMSFLFTAAFLPPIGPWKWIRALHLFFFRSLWVVRLVFVASVASHTGEAFYSWFLAKKVDPENAKAWFWQTLILGFFSLKLLKKRAIRS